MKRLLFIGIMFAIILAFFVPDESFAQKAQKVNPTTIPTYFYWPVWSLKTYAASQKDTSGVLGVAGHRLVSVSTVYDDSVYVLLRVEYRANTSTAWSWVAGDTLNHTGGGVVTGSTKRELVLRGAQTDKFPGLTGQIRLIQVFQATLCGVTTPTYSTSINYKP